MEVHPSYDFPSHIWNNLPKEEQDKIKEERSKHKARGNDILVYRQFFLSSHAGIFHYSFIIIFHFSVLTDESIGNMPNIATCIVY